MNRAGKQSVAQQSTQAGVEGKASGQDAVPLLATRVVDVAFAGDVPAMVSTHAKAVARRSVGTQMEVPHKHTAVQVFGCRECLSLALVLEDSRDNSCVRCNQVNDLLSLVAELKGLIERLRSIRDCESKIEGWSRALPSLRQRQQDATPQAAEDTLPTCHQAEGGALRDRREGKWGPAQGGRRIASRPPSPPQLPLSNRDKPVSFRHYDCPG